ncbi:MAG: hypothetical protein JO187_04295 [Acidobacteria bacterium]|nr:hypothetical protein [Acidobacteriota bacterium]
MRVLLCVLLCAFYVAAAAPPNPTPDFSVVHVSDSEGDAGISGEERDQIVRLLADDDATDWEASRASELRYKRVQLAGAGLNGLFVRSVAKADCGATGNCSTWLLKKSRTKFDLVLNGVSADAVGFEPQTTNGLKNVVASANTSAESSVLNVFAFNGRKYVKQSCYERGPASAKQVPCK